MADGSPDFITCLNIKVQLLGHVAVVHLCPFSPKFWDLVTCSPQK